MKTRHVQPKYAISTHSGKFFDFHNPEKYDFSIEEIAHALSHICRYGGHCNRFYSVAEHSVLVSKLVPVELALCGLLHDASEAFVGDMPKPLKELCKSYQTIENRVQEALANFYNLPYPFPDEIHFADKQMYWTERQEIANNGVADIVWNQDVKPTNKVLCVGYEPYIAKRKFLERYEELTSGQYKAAA